LIPEPWRQNRDLWSPAHTEIEWFEVFFHIVSSVVGTFTHFAFSCFGQYLFLIFNPDGMMTAQG
jgi:hypothetical protein